MTTNDFSLRDTVLKKCLIGSYEKEGVLENTVSKVLKKVPVLTQRIHEIRDSSCSICAKQALQRCPLELLKIASNSSEPKVSIEEIHELLKPNPHRFVGMMKNIVAVMHTQSKIDLERAKQKEAKKKIRQIKDVGDKVVDTLNKIIDK